MICGEIARAILPILDKRKNMLQDEIPDLTNKTVEDAVKTAKLYGATHVSNFAHLKVSLDTWLKSWEADDSTLRGSAENFFRKVIRPCKDDRIGEIVVGYRQNCPYTVYPVYDINLSQKINLPQK